MQIIYLIRDISRIYKEHLQLNNKTTQLKKIGKGSEYTFLQRRYIIMDNKHMKRYSKSLASREMQIKTAMKYHHTQQDGYNKTHI